MFRNTISFVARVYEISYCIIFINNDYTFTPFQSSESFACMLKISIIKFLSYLAHSSMKEVTNLLFNESSQQIGSLFVQQSFYFCTFLRSTKIGF